MNAKRILGAVSASILASLLGALAACGGTPDSSKDAAATAQAVSAASVSIALLDANGVQVGEGSGVLIAPRLVLTSGHLISGKHRWAVTSADGKQKAIGSRGMTYDWRKYDSNKAHPRRHDVGVIHLDESIKLSTYPTLVAEKTNDGTKATRIRGIGGGFESLDATLAKVRSSPNAWLADGRVGEKVDTGGAVFDGRGVVGIVSGRGLTTGKLYIARLDGLTKWLAPKIACAGGVTGTRTYAPPQVDKSKEICEDAGAPGSSGSGSTDGNPGSGGDGSNGSCSGNNDGLCSGGACGGAGGGGSLSGGNSDGSNPGGSTPGGSTPGGTPGGGGANADGSNPGGSTPGTSTPGGSTPGGGQPGVPGGGGANADGSTPGGSTPGGSTPGGGSANSDGSNPGSGSDGSGGEACQGANDNPELCPPEPFGCVGSACGGGAPDDSMDYGNCACGSSSSSGDIYLR